MIKAHAPWHGTWVHNFYLALELSLHNKSSLSLSTTVSCWPLLNHDSYELDFASLTYGLDFTSSMGFRLSIDLVLRYLDLNLLATANVYIDNIN